MSREAIHAMVKRIKESLPKGVVTDAIDLKNPPSPGSNQAVKYGCTCAVMDNHYGRGFQVNGETLFYISGDCPLHARKSGND